MRYAHVIAIASLLSISCDRGFLDRSRSRDHSEDPGNAAPDERPGLSLTAWSATHELFAEYPALVVGQPSAFAAHVTILDGFRPARAGAVSVELVSGGEPPLVSSATEPSQPGIFRPAVTPRVAGPCTLSVAVEREGIRDVFPASACVVHTDAAAAAAARPADESSRAITYLKEQAWVTEFATAAAEERTLQQSLHVRGEIRPAAGREARLAAPVDGWLVLAEPKPVIGTRVERGQVLATVGPWQSGAAGRPAVEAEVASARAELDVARAQRERTERLLAGGTIPQRQMEEARAREQAAEAQLVAARGRLAQYTSGAGGSASQTAAGLPMRSPLGGTLVGATVTADQPVTTGDALFEVVDVTRVWVVGRVFEPDIPRITGSRGAWFTVAGVPDPIEIDGTTGRRVTVGHVVDPQSRTVPLVFEVTNEDSRLRIGQYAEVYVEVGDPVTAVAIPEAAVLEDGGRPVAYVQSEGESFERRPVRLGIRDRGWVEVVEGIGRGERVVTRGAYEVKLAASSGSIPAHGHAH